MRRSADGNGKAEEEGGTDVGLRFGPYSAAVLFDQLFTNGEADPGSLIFSLVMQPLEDAEDFLGVMLFETKTVILYREDPFGTCEARSYVDPRGSFASVFERIIDKILEYSDELRVGFDGGQRVANNYCFRFGNLRVQID